MADTEARLALAEDVKHVVVKIEQPFGFLEEFGERGIIKQALEDALLQPNAVGSKERRRDAPGCRCYARRRQ